MLRACRRVLRSGGRLAFLTIEPTPGLSRSDRRRAHRVGPVAVAVRTDYPSLLASAGFTGIGSTNLTDEYLSTQSAWIAAISKREGAIRAIVGDADFEERMQSRRDTVRAIEGGLLSRFMYWAVRP